MTTIEAANYLGIAEARIKEARELIRSVRMAAPWNSLMLHLAIAKERELDTCAQGFLYPRLHLLEHGWGERSEAKE